tara:strand:+ start:111 stop:368 length:258 start_codon:yes stop_codon:yes gene_type:complete
MRLGLSMVSLGMHPGTTAIIIDDLMWELASAGNLTPLASGVAAVDRNDIWDLDGTNYMPEASPVVFENIEGYWEIDGSTIKPLDV